MERALSLDLVFAAALGLLMVQLREKAPMSEVLASVARLCALARVGSASIAASRLAAQGDDSVSEACRALHDAMEAHGVEAMDIATTMTDTEFLKLAGVLSAAPSLVPGAVVQTAEALSIWNVRFRVAGGPVRPTPRSSEVVAAIDAVPGDHPPGEDVDAPAPSDHTSAGDLLEVAERRGDGPTVCAVLHQLAGDVRFATYATAERLHLVVEQLLDDRFDYLDGHALLDRAGAAGVRVVFEQLVAATEVRERRFLYDLAASLQMVGGVAREFAHDARWYVARNAAGLMGESRDASLVPDLSRLLRHEDQRVRVAAVVALGQIGGASALARLESVLFDASIEVRNRALAIVFAAPDSEPVPARVLMALEEENTLDYRLEMVAALAHVHTPRARARLEAFARATAGSLDDHQLRLEAMTALAAGHLPYATPLLEALLSDANPAVRDRAGALLGR